MNIPYFPEYPVAVSYSTDKDGRPTITLYDNPWEKNAGVSSWNNGGVLISEDDPEYGVIEKKRSTKMIDEYDIYLPPIINLMLQIAAAYHHKFKRIISRCNMQ